MLIFRFLFTMEFGKCESMFLLVLGMVPKYVPSTICNSSFRFWLGTPPQVVTYRCQSRSWQQGCVDEDMWQFSSFMIYYTYDSLRKHSFSLMCECLLWFSFVMTLSQSVYSFTYNLDYLVQKVLLEHVGQFYDKLLVFMLFMNYTLLMFYLNYYNIESLLLVSSSIW